MKKVTLEEKILCGLKTRTSNAEEFDPKSAKIGPLVMNYFHNQLFEKIPNRTKPGVTLCAYTEYESDHTGPYTFFIGEEVSSVDKVPAGMATLIIPAQEYAKMTTAAGPMPDVVINAWKEIWAMSPQELGGKRSYKVDFELYDGRASDRNNTILDLYLGLD